MYLHNIHTPFSHTADAEACYSELSAHQETQGLISEISYNENNPRIAQFILLPLMQQLGQQSRWQLWLTPPQKLSRQWLKSVGLPLTKVMQTSQLAPRYTVNAMVRALETGNYSLVIGWLPKLLTNEEQCRLKAAAEIGNTLGLLMHPMNSSTSASGQFNTLKIHSNFFH